MSDAGLPPTPAPGAGRLMSLDVFRGATIAAMMLVNNPGSWGSIYPPLEHAAWHGWTFTDTIFPFFLWIVGVAIPLSTSRRLEAGQSRVDLFGHAVRRAVIIFGLGMFLATLSPLIDGSLGRLGFGEWLHTYLTSVRIPGVLQRIGVCYLCAMAIFLWADKYRQVSITVGLLVGYWLLMGLAPYSVTVDGQPRFASGLLEKGNNFSAYVDNLVLNGPVIGTHVYKETKTWDPEGIVSTLPAIASVMLGIFAGQLLRSKRTDAEKTAWLMVGGAILMWVGQLMNLWLPINKSIWTSSFTVFMAGLAMICFGVSYWLVDVQGHRRVAKPFAIYGMNAITVFVMSGVIGRIILTVKVRPDFILDIFFPEEASSGVIARPEPVALKSWLYNQFFKWEPLKISSLTWAILWVLMLYLVAWVMYRKKWFVRF